MFKTDKTGSRVSEAAMDSALWHCIVYLAQVCTGLMWYRGARRGRGQEEFLKVLNCFTTNGRTDSVTSSLLELLITAKNVKMMMSPYSVNVSRLTDTFGDTDILDNFGERSANLSRLDPDGQLDLSKNGDCFAYYKSCDHASSPSMTHSAVYRSGHGRVRCRMACKDSKRSLTIVVTTPSGKCRSTSSTVVTTARVACASVSATTTTTATMDREGSRGRRVTQQCRQLRFVVSMFDYIYNQTMY